MMEKLSQLINQDYYNMEKQEFENKAENVTKTTKKEVKVTVVPKENAFVTAETIKLVEDILNDGTIDIKWRAQLKEQVRKYKANGE
jgi:hypothetical protein